jgi:hypothetical protein
VFASSDWWQNCQRKGFRFGAGDSLRVEYEPGKVTIWKGDEKVKLRLKGEGYRVCVYMMERGSEVAIS